MNNVCVICDKIAVIPIIDHSTEFCFCAIHYYESRNAYFAGTVSFSSWLRVIAEIRDKYVDE